MKIVIEIPEKTNAHIRSDYGHGLKGLRTEDRKILCDAIYHGTPYEERPHGEWKADGTCSECGVYSSLNKDTAYFCPDCGADMRRARI